MDKAKEEYSFLEEEALNMSLSDILNLEDQESKRQTNLDGVGREMHTHALSLKDLRYRYSNPNSERVCGACKQVVTKEEDVEALNGEITEVVSYLSHSILKVWIGCSSNLIFLLLHTI